MTRKAHLMFLLPNRGGSRVLTQSSQPLNFPAVTTFCQRTPTALRWTSTTRMVNRHASPGSVIRPFSVTSCPSHFLAVELHIIRTAAPVRACWPAFLIDTVQPPSKSRLAIADQVAWRAGPVQVRRPSFLHSPSRIVLIHNY